MYTIDVLLLVVKSEPENRLRGRTLLQKKVYFLSVLMGVNFDFTAHRYGPYSSVLAGHLDSLVAHGFLNEDIESFATASTDRNVFGEIRRHTYFLTDDAEELWSDIENDSEFPEWKEKLDCINAHEIAHDFNKLSIAAKVHYIVSWRGKRTIEQVQKVAREYGWNVEKDDIEGVLSFLTALGLVTPDESDDIPF